MLFPTFFLKTAPVDFHAGTAPFNSTNEFARCWVLIKLCSISELVVERHITRIRQLTGRPFAIFGEKDDGSLAQMSIPWFVPILGLTTRSSSQWMRPCRFE